MHAACRFFWNSSLFPQGYDKERFANSRLFFLPGELSQLSEGITIFVSNCNDYCIKRKEARFVSKDEPGSKLIDSVMPQATGIILETIFTRPQSPPTPIPLSARKRGTDEKGVVFIPAPPDSDPIRKGNGVRGITGQTVSDFAFLFHKGFDAFGQESHIEGLLECFAKPTGMNERIGVGFIFTGKTNDQSLFVLWIATEIAGNL